MLSTAQRLWGNRKFSGHMDAAIPEQRPEPNKSLQVLRGRVFPPGLRLFPVSPQFPKQPLRSRSTLGTQGSPCGSHFSKATCSSGIRWQKDCLHAPISSPALTRSMWVCVWNLSNPAGKEGQRNQEVKVTFHSIHRKLEVTVGCMKAQL